MYIYRRNHKEKVKKERITFLLDNMSKSKTHYTLFSSPYILIKEIDEKLRTNGAVERARVNMLVVANRVWAARNTVNFPRFQKLKTAFCTVLKALYTDSWRKLEAKLDRLHWSLQQLTGENRKYFHLHQAPVSLSAFPDYK